jgi:nicotinate-nucleotide pyrophosphorylase (carboxylating)
MGRVSAVLPPMLLVDRMLEEWLLEDIGRGDRTTQGLFSSTDQIGTAVWIMKEAGVVAGLPIALRVFQRLDPQASYNLNVEEGQDCPSGQQVAQIQARLDALMMGERVALNLIMRLSGIATATRRYVEAIADLPACLVDTRKTTPGLRIFEKYASQVGGATNHRMGLDDGVMLKDNHIAAMGSLADAVRRIRPHMPYPLSLEVETTTLAQVREALEQDVDIIMLDNMPVETMHQAVELIRAKKVQVKIEASGNITLATIRAVAQTGVDYVSTSAPITRSHWLDVSMRIKN